MRILKFRLMLVDGFEKIPLHVEVYEDQQSNTKACLLQILKERSLAL